MRKGLDQQKLAVQSGHWALYRFNPLLSEEGKNPFILDSKEPSVPLESYIYNESRYKMLQQSDVERAGELLVTAKEDVKKHWKLHQQMANLDKQN
jgi:pyruvate-ferredoxin/flavodoxin oxidoreductase